MRDLLADRDRADRDALASFMVDSVLVPKFLSRIPDPHETLPPFAGLVQSPSPSPSHAPSPPPSDSPLPEPGYPTEGRRRRGWEAAAAAPSGAVRAVRGAGRPGELLPRTRYVAGSPERTHGVGRGGDTGDSLDEFVGRRGGRGGRGRGRGRGGGGRQGWKM